MDAFSLGVQPTQHSLVRKTQLTFIQIPCSRQHVNHPITIIMVENHPEVSLYVESAVVTAGESSWGDGFYVGYQVQSASETKSYTSYLFSPSLISTITKTNTWQATTLVTIWLHSLEEACHRWDFSLQQLWKSRSKFTSVMWTICIWRFRGCSN